MPVKQPYNTQNGTHAHIPLLACACGVMSISAKSDVLPKADPDGLLHGVRVSVLGTGAGWLKVETDDGRQGWVKDEYIGDCQ